MVAEHGSRWVQGRFAPWRSLSWAMGDAPASTVAVAVLVEIAWTCQQAVLCEGEGAEVVEAKGGQELQAVQPTRTPSGRPARRPMPRRTPLRALAARVVGLASSAVVASSAVAVAATLAWRAL